MSEARAFIDLHLGEILAQFPLEIRDPLSAKFTEFYASPHTSQLELVLRKRLTDTEVRHLLFAPTPPQYRYYATLLSQRGDMVWTTPIGRRFLTLFYLKHARTWPLVVEFILHDGLQSLVDRFVDQDLQSRGQVIDSFVQITSTTAFDWFAPPRGDEHRRLHAKMLALANSPSTGIVGQIVATLQLHEQEGMDRRLPGGTFVLLQVLAFYLSWVRKHSTQNELRLSRHVLDLLRDWPKISQSDTEEELALATQVYEDFSRWPAIDEQQEIRGQDDATGRHLRHHACGDSSALFSVARVDKLLADGTQDALERVLTLCTDAIGAGIQVTDAMLARARAYARQPTAEAASLCLGDCKSLLHAEPANVDAWRLRLQVMEQRGLWIAGRDALDEWAQVQPQCLPEDVAFFTAQQELFTAKAEEEAQNLRREQQRHAAKEAKQQQVFELLMQRPTWRQGGRVGINSSSIDTNPRDAPIVIREAAPTTTTPGLPPRDDVLARFRSSSAAKKKPGKPVVEPSSLSNHRSFLRKFTQCKKDPMAVRTLLDHCTFQDASEALQAGIPEASLRVVLEALTTQASSTPQAARLLQLVLSLPRFQLMRELASRAEQAAIDTLVSKAQAILAGETALAA